MMRFKSLKHKLLTAFLVFGLVPLTAVGYLAYTRADAALETRAGEKLTLQAQAAINSIDRNLFERYGDVQAFAANPMSRGPRAEVERIADFLTKNYGIYDLMIVADTNGTIIAANTIDYEGKRANTSSLIGRSVKGEEWFEQCISGDIGPGETYYSDLEFDAMTASVTGERGLGLNFSAPVFSDSGKVVRVWSNRASWARTAKDIVNERIAVLKAQGLTTLEYQVLNRSGIVIDDYDPEAVLKLNLADIGLEAAKQAVKGEDGYTIETHKRRNVEQINGHAASHGALGFDGYGWSMLIRQDRQEAVLDAAGIRTFVMILALVAVVLIAISAIWISKGISEPIAETAETLDGVAAGDYSRVLDFPLDDEVGRLAKSVNSMSRKIKEAMEKVREAADRESAQAAEQKDKVDDILTVVDAVAAGDYGQQIKAHGSDAIGRLGEALTKFFEQKQESERRTHEAVEVERRTQTELRSKVDKILAAVTAAAEGNLNVELSVTGDDPAGRIADGLRDFLGGLRQTISNLATSSSDLSRNAGDLSSVSGEMTDSARQTSSSAEAASEATDQVNKNVQLVASSVEEMTASIREIARSSSDAASIANQAVGVAGAANDTIQGLGDAGTEIGNVVKVITSIAEQTNLLALNATIEAARAGEAGKGFAVVANEVKELAKQTASATEDISGRIEAIQSGATGAVEAIGEVGKIINQINDISNTIAASVQEQEATTNEISRSVSEAARGSGEIAQNITGVAKTADSTATGANGVMHSAKGLTETSDQLQQIVSKFRI